MKKIILQFFQDDKGNLSMTRLVTFILCVGGLVFAYIYPDYEAGYLGIITLGLGGKISQKRIEKMKNESKAN